MGGLAFGQRPLRQSLCEFLPLRLRLQGGIKNICTQSPFRSPVPARGRFFSKDRWEFGKNQQPSGEAMLWTETEREVAPTCWGGIPANALSSSRTNAPDFLLMLENALPLKNGGVVGQEKERTDHNAPLKPVFVRPISLIVRGHFKHTLRRAPGPVRQLDGRATYKKPDQPFLTSACAISTPLSGLGHRGIHLDDKGSFFLTCVGSPAPECFRFRDPNVFQGSSPRSLYMRFRRS